jgi:inner membrane protein
MDPVSQAVFGAAAAQVATTGRLGKLAFACGAVGGLLPDVDVVIRSAADPLLAVEMHRHFTHSLLFVPIGGALAALPFLLKRDNRRRAGPILAACTLGCTSHAPLDVLTSYGTLWWWPFSHARLELDWMSIVDPLFTIPLLLLTVLSMVRTSRRLAAAAALFALSYIGLGAALHHNAFAVQRGLAAARGHAVEHGRVMATLGNVLVWRSVYVAGGEIHADAIRVSPFAAPAVVEGQRVPLVSAPPLDLTPDRALSARFARDLARFSWFADGFVARDPTDPTALADMRYSLATERFEPLWGVRFHADGRTVPVEWVELMRHRESALVELWQLVTGTSPHLRAWLL